MIISWIYPLPSNSHLFFHFSSELQAILDVQGVRCRKPPGLLHSLKVGNPYKPSFATVTTYGVDPNPLHAAIYVVWALRPKFLDAQ